MPKKITNPSSRAKLTTGPRKTTKSVEKKAVKEEKPVQIVEPVVAAPIDEESQDFVITEKDLASKSDRYFEATVRRKTATARVRLFTKGEKQFLVNGKPYQEYFTTDEDKQTAVASMVKMKCLDKFRVTAIVRGGGHSAQAEAVRHGTARVLVDFNLNFKKRLRKVGYLTRDPRMRERKKFGLKRARRAPQWAKR